MIKINYDEPLEIYINRQLNSFFGNCRVDEVPIAKALLKVERCFSYSANKYFSVDGMVRFSPLHAVQYSIFIYYLSRVYFLEGNTDAATKLYYLNKMLHSLDWFYEVELPEVWCAEHPLCSVLGRAQYSNGLFIYQGTTIGGSHGKYPVLGRNVLMYSNSSILGNCRIGDNVILSTGVTVLDTDIPNNSFVFGTGKQIQIVTKDKEYMQQKMAHIWKSKLFKEQEL